MGIIGPRVRFVRGTTRVFMSCGFPGMRSWFQIIAFLGENRVEVGVNRGIVHYGHAVISFSIDSKPSATCLGTSRA